MRKHLSLWLHILAGGALGMTYVVIDEGVLDQIPTGGLVTLAHEFMDMVLPILLGFTVGAGLYLFRRQTRLNQRLSLGNDRLKQELLFHAWISQILHEIQNPLHNLSALLEEGSGLPEEDRRQAIQRNLEKLMQLKSRYGKLASLGTLDPGEKLAVKPWLTKLLDEKIHFQLTEIRAGLVTDIEAVELFIHPLFLEQILIGLFSNAIEAVEKTSDRGIRLSVHPDKNAPGRVLMVMTNTGRFPDEVLQAQGSRLVESRRGMGLGLLLIRTIVDQVGGNISLSNLNGQARVEIRLPGGSS